MNQIERKALCRVSPTVTGEYSHEIQPTLVGSMIVKSMRVCGIYHTQTAARVVERHSVVLLREGIVP